jgi:molybdopterin-binding protein
MTPHRLTVEDLSLRVGVFELRDIGLTVAADEVLVILGPSGAGKTLLLETIAGFNRPDRGRIAIGGEDVTAAPPEARRIGFMFQDYALFPHLTVAQNVAFGRRFAAPSADAEPVEALLERLGVQHLAGRKPGHLSGGEKQRVALARALAASSRLLLFDEPLAALDAQSRAQLRRELKEFLRRAAVPAVYVTHDQAEALALADTIAVMREGSLVQAGTPSEIFNTPADAAVAEFVGVETVVEGRVVAVSDGVARIDVGGRFVHAAGAATPSVGAAVLACIRPEDVALTVAAQSNSSVRNQFAARLVATEPAGPLFKITLDCGFPLVAYVSKQSYLELDLANRAEAVASVKATAVHLIAR